MFKVSKNVLKYKKNFLEYSNFNSRFIFDVEGRNDAKPAQAQKAAAPFNAEQYGEARLGKLELLRKQEAQDRDGESGKAEKAKEGWPQNKNSTERHLLAGITAAQEAEIVLSLRNFKLKNPDSLVDLINAVENQLINTRMESQRTLLEEKLKIYHDQMAKFIEKESKGKIPAALVLKYIKVRDNYSHAKRDENGKLTGGYEGMHAYFGSLLVQAIEHLIQWTDREAKPVEVTLGNGKKVMFIAYSRGVYDLGAKDGSILTNEELEESIKRVYNLKEEDVRRESMRTQVESFKNPALKIDQIPNLNDLKGIKMDKITFAEAKTFLPRVTKLMELFPGSVRKFEQGTTMYAVKNLQENGVKRPFIVKDGKIIIDVESSESDWIKAIFMDLDRSNRYADQQAEKTAMESQDYSHYFNTAENWAANKVNANPKERAANKKLAYSERADVATQLLDSATNAEYRANIKKEADNGNLTPMKFAMIITGLEFNQKTGEFIDKPADLRALHQGSRDHFFGGWDAPVKGQRSMNARYWNKPDPTKKTP